MQETVGIRTVENGSHPYQFEWATYYTTCICGEEIWLGGTVRRLVEQGDIELKCRACPRVIKEKTQCER